MDLNDVLQTECTLPSLPRAVALLTTELARPEPSLRRINQFFLTDPALAARLLREANVRSHPLSGTVGSVPEAIVLLDLPQLRAFVAQAFLGTTSGSVPGINLQHFWRYSRNTARLARSLAGIVHRNQTLAYSAGLLHGLGELVLHLRNPAQSHELSRTVAPLDLRRARHENRVWGYSYAAVSARLARQWRLPAVLVDALRYHCAPFDEEVYEPLAAILHLAAWRARAREGGLGERELAATFPGEVGVVLDMDIDTVLQQDPIDWKAQPNADDMV
ncbi:HDOD domain-containing protein [Comamonas flocculans]|uniref:HDOD domain-containing protein n=1 Tax=Comamonas flocculans TaxID=2597701 RepID=A0A5B8RRC6_9BURK|nr:HDOD domain-containing protein [Comamonas flocculans]QEA11563.1 HDOD domain-containing protein [Comamonas flocculans]